jgi:hypothetical protein
MKNATNHKARGDARPHRKRRITVRGLHVLPDGLTPNDLEWEDAPSVIAALEQRWAKWRKLKNVIDADWLKASRHRVQEAAKEINADRLNAALEAEEEKRRKYFAEDAAQNEAYVRALGSAIKKSADARNAAWRTAAEARLRRATKAINADINRRDRELLQRKQR